MKRDVVIKRLKEASTHEGGKLANNLDSDVITQIASALTSNSQNLRDLVTLDDVAKYYEISSDDVRDCIEIAMKQGYLRFSVAKATLKRLDGNQHRHYHFSGGISDSAQKQREYIRHRIQHFCSDFNSNINKYRKAMSIYLNGESLEYVKGRYGFYTSEFVYLAVRIACTHMRDQEFSLFQRKFMDDFIGEIGYFSLMDFIEAFRKAHNVELSTLEAGKTNVAPIESKLEADFLKSFKFSWI